MPFIFKIKNKFLIFKIHFIVFETRRMFLFKKKYGFCNIRNSISYMRYFIIISIINFLILEIGYFILENEFLILQNEFMILQNEF